MGNGLQKAGGTPNPAEVWTASSSLQSLWPESPSRAQQLTCHSQLVLRGQSHEEREGGVTGLGRDDKSLPNSVTKSVEGEPHIRRKTDYCIVVFLPYSKWRFPRSR